MNDAIEATAEEIGAELVPVSQPGTLFRTDDPVEVLERATRVAQALKSVIDKQGLATRIQGREHVRVEGWQTCGAMLGVVPVIEWTRRVEGGWEARCEARTLDERTIGAAESMCTKSEGKPWDKRPDFALRSMAQTRATSKALSGPLRFIVALAGYEATPAEEMPTEGGGPADFGRPASPEQKKYVQDLFKKKGLKTVAQIKPVLLHAGVPKDLAADPAATMEVLTGAWASNILNTLTKGPIPTGGSDVPPPADGEFTHEPVEGDESLPFDPTVAS